MDRSNTIEKPQLYKSCIPGTIKTVVRGWTFMVVACIEILMFIFGNVYPNDQLLLSCMSNVIWHMFSPPAEIEYFCHAIDVNTMFTTAMTVFEQYLPPNSIVMRIGYQIIFVLYVYHLIYLTNPSSADKNEHVVENNTTIQGISLGVLGASVISTVAVGLSRGTVSTYNAQVVLFALLWVVLHCMCLFLTSIGTTYQIPYLANLTEKIAKEYPNTIYLNVYDIGHLCLLFAYVTIKFGGYVN